MRPCLAIYIVATLMFAGCLSIHGKRITRSFPADGIAKVVLRASEAESATVTTDVRGSSIEVSGLQRGGSRGYHSSDPNWRETRASDWDFDLVAQRYGDTLVVCPKGEIHWIHTHYFLESLHLRVPAGVEVVRERRVIRESRSSLEPDLSAP
jgi:hypothetical protein